MTMIVMINYMFNGNNQGLLFATRNNFTVEFRPLGIGSHWS